MQFFIDSANIDEIKKAQELGLVNGVTTNPSLLAKEKTDWQRVAHDICALVPGPVSLEVLGDNASAMVDEARELITYGPNVVIKIPMGRAGLKAVNILHQMHIETNMTLVFSALQALLAAKAGASFVSPFLGRLDDIGQNGVQLVRDIHAIFKIHDLKTKIIAASIRNTAHVLDVALAGAHIATIPYKILEQMIDHPLTDQGIQAFAADWQGQNFKI